jgi:hypothetical protein
MCPMLIGFKLKSYFWINYDANMTIHVLGLGESLRDYTPDGSTTIGVNDIHSRVKTDYVVCVDLPRAFSTDRLEVINNTECKGFYSQLNNWSQRHNFVKIELANGRGLCKDLDGEKFCYSICSPYVAAVLAYKMGAKKIVLHGVDFVTHKSFVDHKRDKAIKDFELLNSELLKRGVRLFVGSSYSELSKVLPTW